MVRTRRFAQWVVLSLIALAAVVILACWYDRTLALHAAEDHVELTVDTMREHSLKVFTTLELVFDQIRLRTAPLDPETISRSETIARFLRETRDRMNPISSIVLTDAAGRVLASSQSPSPPSLAFADRADLVAHRESDGRTVFGEPRLGTFSLSQRRSSTGEFDGIISIEISAGYFENFFRGLDDRYRHRALIVRKDGTVLAANSRVEELPTFPPTSALMRSIATNIQSDDWTSSAVGVTHFFRWRRLEPYPIYVAYAIDREVALRSWYGHVVFFAACGGLAWLALSLIAYQASRRAVAEAALEQAQRMKAIGQLASGVAHDFNNLLTAVIGNVDMIVADRHVTPRVRQFADAALRAAMRGASLTSHLLAFARRQPLRPQAVRVGVVLEAILPLIKDAVGETIKVSIKLDSNLAPIRVDPGQLDSALLNLALNARDAMPGGGKLRIEARNVAFDPDEATRRAITSGDYVVIEISDNGSGMPERVVDRAFEPFFTTKETGKGSGLGLSMVYGFARQSGGTAEIESRIDVGTTIRLYFPSSDATAAPEQRPSAAHPIKGRKRVILVVEDHAEVRHSVARALEEQGHEVKTAHDADEAIGILARDGSIQALLTDIILPGRRTGLDLAREARELAPDLKILTMSGTDSGESITTSGLDDCAFLSKPFRPADLNKAIDQLL
jgi:signal transduction histidine kinase